MWWQKYIGIPFKEKGRGNGGLDCYGLLQQVYRQERGIELPDMTNLYETTQDKHLAKMIDSERRKWNEVAIPQAFDVIILRMEGLPLHIGIYTANGFMLHCSKDINTTHEKLSTMRWRNRVMGFYRYA